VSLYFSDTDTSYVLRPPKNLRPAEAKFNGTVIEASRPIFFEFDDATIRHESDEILEKIAEAITRSSSVPFFYVDGHTDRSGGDVYNKTLSNRRAHAVVERLIKLGVPANRLRARGFGSECPYDPHSLTTCAASHDP